MTHGGSGVLFLSAVAGYWVLERAEAHKGSLRKAGKLVGWIVILGSLIGVACRVCSLACPVGVSCPFMSKGSPPASVPSK